MPGWIPRWHPVIWVTVIVLIYLIVTDPADMAVRAQGVLRDIEHIFSQLGVFAKGI